jgi:hypothetical protein
MWGVLLVVPGVIALLTPVSPSEPGWLIFKIVLIVGAFAIAAANLVGLLVKRSRHSRDNENS